MIFYDLVNKKKVEVPARNIKHKEMNGRYMCVATMGDRKLYKIVKKEEALKYPKMK